jgi:putative flippase GtrA
VAPRWPTRFLRYAVGSGAATLTSAIVFALIYRVLDGGPRSASGAAFLAGAVVNFAAGRFWAWGRRGRPGLHRDVVRYALVAVGSAVAATVVASLTHAYSTGLAADRRAVLVEASYFATYAVLFGVKFLVLDRLVFRSRHQVPNTTRA